MRVRVVAFATFALALYAQRAEAEEFDIDAIGSVRLGFGYSYLFDSRVLSLSFEDQFQVKRLSRSTVATFVFGMDGQRPLDNDRRGFLGATLGTGLLHRVSEGPAFTLAGTGSPLFQSRNDQTKLAGFGVGLRGEAFPFYQSLVEVVECKQGLGATYVLSGLHGWAQVRRDWIGSGGNSYAVGFGFDLGRNVILPVLGAMLDGSCAKSNPH